MDRIELLKKQHLYIKELIKKISTFSNSIELKPLMTQLESIVKSHFKDEKDILFPNLIKDSNSMDIGVITLINMFVKTMNEISTRLDNFFNNYLNLDSINTQNFNKDFNNLSDLLIKRFQTEEKNLYPLFEKFCLISHK